MWWPLYLACCVLLILAICAPRYRPGRIIIPATKDRFTNNLPDLSQLLCVPINTHELDTITSNIGTIFSNTLETVAPIKWKKFKFKVYYKPRGQCLVQHQVCSHIIQTKQQTQHPTHLKALQQWEWNNVYTDYFMLNANDLTTLVDNATQWISMFNIYVTIPTAYGEAEHRFDIDV